MIRKVFTILIILVPYVRLCEAQRYPATATIQLIPPYSVNLEDYASPAIDRLLISAVFNDFSVEHWKVKFRITVSGNGIQIQTNPNLLLSSFRLVPGQLEQFSGMELGEYFSYNNMTFSGISLAQLQSNGGLPEGLYNFTVEILDFNTGIPISNKAIATATLMLNDPPQISLPACGNRITDTNPQNILFQWLPLHHGSPNSTFTTDYELTIVEVPDGLNPNEAIRSGLPIFRTTTDVNSFQYDISAPLLENGKTYAYRVQATDSDNLGLFKNGGHSDVCWFTFGFDTGGKLALQSPGNGSIINGDSRLVFSWAAPDNVSNAQLIHYKYLLVKVEEGQEASAAMLTNPPFYEESFPEGSAGSGWSFQLPVELETESRYAWQVTAHTGEVEIAASNIYTINSSPKIDQFNAGQHVVKIKSLDNEDLLNLTGTGTVKLAADGTAYEVQFSNLKLSMLAGKLFLKEGMIMQELPEHFPDITLTPTEKANGESTFYPKQIYLNSNALEISGHLEWPLPFPQVSGEVAIVKTETSRLNFDNYRLNGSINLDNSNQYQLLDPYGFDLLLLPSSDFFLHENVFTQNFNAEVLLPAGVKSIEGRRVMVKLRKAHQLFVNQIKNTEQPIVPINNIDMTIVPDKIHLDFSRTISPGKFGNRPLWTGVYIEDFKVRYAKQIDKLQLALDEPVSQSFSLKGTEFQAWVDGEGLDFKIEKAFESTNTDYARFNEFYGKINDIDVLVENNFLRSGTLNGSIHIAYLKDGYFDYTIPFSHEGFEEGYLVEDLAGKNYTFSEGKADEVSVSILQAVFEDNNKLDMSIAMEWPSVGIGIENIPKFKLWGNGNIGFGKINGDQALPNQLPGKLYNYAITAHTVGAGLTGEKYYMKLISDIVLDEEISGKNGAPTIDLYSLVTADRSEVEMKRRGGEGMDNSRQLNKNVPDIENPVGGELFLDSIYIDMKMPMGSLAGYAKLTLNDPDWGNALQGSLKGEITVPVPYRTNATFVMGKKDGSYFSFFEAGMGMDAGSDLKSKKAGAKAGAKRDGNTKATRTFQSVEKYNRGLAINKQLPVLGPLSIIGMDLRYYKHMSHTDPAAIRESGAGGSVTFRPDPSNDYGIYGRLAARDLPTKGEAFNFDLGFEYSQSTAGESRYAFEGTIQIGAKNSKSKKGGTLGTGTGKLIYDEAEKHWLGDFWLSVKKDRVLCAEGGLAFSAKPNYWRVALGNENRKIKATPFCHGQTYEGYLIFDPNQFEIGLGMGYELSLKSPEVSIVGNDFVIKLDAGFTAGVLAGIRVKPDFAILKAGVYIDMWAALAVDYDTWFDSGTWEIASANLTGTATVYFEPKKKLVGKLYGEVEVLDFGIDFNMKINQAF